MGNHSLKKQGVQMAKKEEKTTATNARILPNNLEAEQAVLASALLDGDCLPNIVAKLTTKDFYSETHGIIFDCIVRLYTQNEPVDMITLCDELEKIGKLQYVGGMNYITVLTNAVPSSAYAETYIDIVKRDSTLRQIIKACSDISQVAYGRDEDALSFAEKTIFEISEKGQVSSLVALNKTFEETMEVFERIFKDGGISRGLKTGFHQFDQKTNGLQKSDLIIIAARPGIGKTSFSMNIVSNAALNEGAKCAVFSLEMSKEQLAQRMICSVSGVSMAKALKGDLSESDWSKLWKAQKKLAECDIYVDDSSLNKPSQIISKCRKLKREKGLDLIMIDYLQLMTSDAKADNRQNEVADISRQMKILAKEINVPVLLLSQLSRAVEQRQGKRPMLSDLRESGSIEQDADMVIFIHRDTEPNPNDQEQGKKDGSYEAEFIIAKYRSGEPGSFFLGWDGSRTTFVNLAKDANEQSLINAYAEQHDKSRKAPPEDVPFSVPNDVPFDIPNDIPFEPMPEDVSAALGADDIFDEF